MFKVGDTVKYVNPNLSLYNCIGVVTKAYPSTDQYEVSFKTSSMTPMIFMCNSKEIELVSSLPMGNQMPLGSASLLMDEALDDVSGLFGVHEDQPDYKHIGAPFCDCGGYKVFGTMSSEAHSPWCSIFTKN